MRSVCRRWSIRTLTQPDERHFSATNPLWEPLLPLRRIDSIRSRRRSSAVCLTFQVTDFLFENTDSLEQALDLVPKSFVLFSAGDEPIVFGGGLTDGRMKLLGLPGLLEELEDATLIDRRDDRLHVG